MTSTLFEETRIPPEEQAKVAGERVVWVYLLKLLAPPAEPGTR